jgi:hypothetical protein
MNTNIKLLAAGGILVVGISGAFALTHGPDKTLMTNSHALFPQFTGSEIVQQSDAIAIARVKDIKSVKSASTFRVDSEDVITTATLEVEKYLRNFSSISSQEIVVRTLGGSVGTVQMSVDGAASFEKGERVLVFLTQEEDGAFTVYGWENGKYSLGEDDRIGISEDEIGRFRNIFGEVLTIGGLENFVKKFSTVPPTEKNLERQVPPEDVSTSMDSKARNEEANKTINSTSN